MLTLETSSRVDRGQTGELTVPSSTTPEWTERTVEPRYWPMVGVRMQMTPRTVFRLLGMWPRRANKRWNN